MPRFGGQWRLVTWSARHEPAAPHPPCPWHRDSRAGLQQLYAANAKAKGIGAEAKAVLVFPKIVKAGAMVGAQTGEGALPTAR